MYMYMSAQLACKYSTLPRQKVHTGASMPHHASKQKRSTPPRAPPPESWRHPWENSISSFRKRMEDSPRCFKNQVPSGKLTWQWKIPILCRKYIFQWDPFPIAMWIFTRVSYNSNLKLQQISICYTEF